MVSSARGPWEMRRANIRVAEKSDPAQQGSGAVGFTRKICPWLRLLELGIEKFQKSSERAVASTNRRAPSGMAARVGLGHYRRRPLAAAPELRPTVRRRNFAVRCLPASYTRLEALSRLSAMERSPECRGTSQRSLCPCN